MKNDIFDLFRGIHRIEETDDGYLYPIRMTEKQEKFFVDMGPAMGMRAHCSAGVRIDIVTDASVIAFSYKLGEAYSKNVAFDLYINNVLAASHMNDGSEEGRVEWELRRYDAFPYKEKERRVTVHFPCIAQTFIKDMSLGNARPAERYGDKILFFGDSITQGVNCALHASFNFCQLASRYLECEYINLGVGSACFCPDFIDGSLGFEPNEIVVAYGANDAVITRDKDTIGRNIPLFFERLTDVYKGIPVYALTPVWSWREDVYGEYPRSEAENERMLFVLDSIRESAARYGAKVIEGFDLMPHMTDFFHRRDPHPNEFGFSVYGAELANAIRKLR